MGVGVLFGVINTLAGGGSILSLPALLLLGIPPHAANATNRLGGVIQTLSAAWSFTKRGVLPKRELISLTIYALIGGSIGSWVSLLLTQNEMEWCIQICLGAVALFTLLAPRSLFEGPPLPERSQLSQHIWGLIVSFYGGFLQAGIGLVSLYYLRLIKSYDLVTATALKAAFIALFTVPALGVFIYYGHVYWVAGAALAIGSMIGAQIGVKLSLSSQGEQLIRRALPVAALMMIGGLIWRSM